MDPVHTAQTIRMPASAEVCVDSMDRYVFGNAQPVEPTTSSNWRTNLPQYVLNGYFTRLAVTQILFNWNLPTIITDYNDLFEIFNVTTNTSYAIVLNEGFYTPDELAAEIQAELQAADGAAGFTCVFDGTAFRIDATDSFQFNTSPTGGNELQVQRTLITMGMLYAASETAGGVTSYTGSIPTLLPSRYIDMFSSYITKFQDVKDATTALGSPSFNCVIARIYPTGLNNVKGVPIDGGSGIVDSPAVITMEYNTPKYIMWNPREALANFDIQLRDEFGQLIPWNTTYGCEYTITLFASET